MSSIFKPFTTALLLFAAVSVANAQDIRPGHDTPEVTDLFNLDDFTEWSMDAGMEAGGLAPHHVTAERVSHGARMRFSRIIEYILDEPDRYPFYQRLFKAGYYTEVTPRGVSYQIDEYTDLKMRVLSQKDARETRYEPHDCKRTIGACAFEKHVGKRVFHFIRTSSFADGVWRDSVAYDPVRDPKGRDDLIEESTFSVDEYGVLIDAEIRRFSRLGTNLTRMTRVGLGEADPSLPPALALPEGSYFSTNVTCSAPERMIEISGVSRKLANADKWVTNNEEDALVSLECGPKQTSSGSCRLPGHVIVLANEGRVGFGCYEGAAPKG